MASRSKVTRALRRLCSLLLLTLLIVVAAPLASAHAELRDAYPEVGAVFRWERPAEVRLGFTQPLVEASIVVTNRQFVPVQSGDAILDTEDDRVAVLPLPPLAPGTYTVNWRSLSTDGHPLEGSYDFTILSRAPLVTLVVAVVVFSLFSIFIYTRRAGPEELDNV